MLRLSLAICLILCTWCQFGTDDLVTVPLVDGYGPYPYYSGYLNISASKAFHYVFFTSQHDSSNDPLVLWLNGGPGCSSLIGMVYQNGPFKFDTNTTHMRLNNDSWNTRANLLYIESPGSVGFSIGPNNHTDESVSQDNFNALTVFYAKFPKLRGNALYLSGESYAGVYIPWLALRIHEYNQRATTTSPFNFKGFMIGNACTDPMECYDPGLQGSSMFQYEFLYKHGFYNDKDYMKLQAYCTLGYFSQTCRQFRKELDRKFDDTKTSINNIYAPCYNQVYDGKSHRRKISVGGCGDSMGAYLLFNDPLIRQRLNLGGFNHSIKWDLCAGEVEDKYVSDPRASYWIYPTLMKAGYRLWVYSGDIDANVPITGTIRWLSRLREEFELPVMEPWRQWWIKGLHKYEDEMGGMLWKLKNITFVSIRGAGHLVPSDKPKAALAMLHAFMDGVDLPDKQ